MEAHDRARPSPCSDAQVQKLRAEVKEMDARIAEAETLLRFADPENYFRQGTRAAAEARTKGLRQHAVERQRALEQVRVLLSFSGPCHDQCQHWPCGAIF